MYSKIIKGAACVASLFLSGCDIHEVVHKFNAESIKTKAGELRFGFGWTDYFEKHSVLRGNPYKIKVNLYSDEFYKDPTIADALEIHLHYRLFQGDKLVLEKNVKVEGEKNITIGNVRLFDKPLTLEYADHRIDAELKVFNSSGTEIESITASVPVKYTRFDHSGPPL